MQDVKVPSSSKGKAREDVQWQLGWWDTCHSFAGPRRPLVWSKSSVIFTAHPTDPLIVARHFPSSKQFTVPSPSPVLSSPASYEPPTVVSVSPGDDWLFAYYPGRDGDGAGCLWKRGTQLDSWQVREWWTFPAGAGAVAADWVCSQREWIVTDTDTAVRLPPRGPLSPLCNPILLLITQNHQINVCYLPRFSPSLKIIRASLIQAGRSPDSQPSATDDTMTDFGGQSLCVHAAIGMTYNNSSIVLAMRSSILPPRPNGNLSQESSMELDMPFDVAQSSPSSEVLLPPEWEFWGEEATIRLCEVNLSFRLDTPVVTIRPLTPITDANHTLSNLLFIPEIVSSKLSETPTNSEEVAPFVTRGQYLVASFLDLGDYTSTPRSEILVYTFLTDSSKGDPVDSSRPWSLICKQAFEDKVLDFLLPYPLGQSMLAGFVNLTGTIPGKKSTKGEVPIGRMVMLKLPNVNPADDWEEAPLLSSLVNGGRDVPANVAYSPNHCLICSISPSTSMNSLISIHDLPHPRELPVPPPNAHSSSLHHGKRSSRLLVAASLSRNSPSDVLHALTMSTVPDELVIATLDRVRKLLQENSHSLTDDLMNKLLGFSIETYLARSRRTSNSADKENLIARWRAAHDIRSLSTCCNAFEQCREGTAYDIDAVWQLVGLSGWIVEFTENLLKECVLTGDGLTKSSTASTQSTPPVPDSPLFIHLVHPHPLSKLKAAVIHVKRFRDHIATLTAKGENEQIAKDVLMDIVDCSGVDLDRLNQVLGEIGQDLKTFDVEELHKSLVACYPLSSLRQHVRKAIDRILNSGILNRPRLFIKPGDLIDGISRLSLVEKHSKIKQRDVVHKGLLLQRPLSIACVRCGGFSQIGLDHDGRHEVSIRWRTWQRQWITNCICGGSWIKAAGVLPSS